MKKSSLLFFSILLSSFIFGQLPYFEDFTGENNKGAVGPTPTIDLTGVDWTIDVSSALLTASTDWFQVQNEVMEAQDTDGEVIWTSPSIDVTGLSSTVNLSVDFSEDGNHESADYAQAYYSLDGGAEVLFATNGNNTDDFTAVTAEQTLTFSGNTSLHIIIKMKNNAGAELLRFNNVSVEELAPCTEPIDQPTSLLLTTGATSISGSFTEAASLPDNYIVIVSTSSSLSSNPVDGISYNIGDALGGGTIVTKTSINSFRASDLTQGTQYYFFVFAFNSKCSGAPNYNTTDTELTGNVTTETVPNIIITEIMQNPNAVADADGEYFEIYNNSGADVDIDGWIIKDNGSNTHTIDNGGSLIIANEDFLVLGINNNLGTNDGVTVDYQYTSFSLTNTDDEVILQNSSGIEVDRVEYDGGPDFPSPTGASMYLKFIQLDNNIGSYWETSTTSVGITTDKGSPGSSGEAQLPVELISFKGSKTTEGVQLIWQTANELNNDYFIVQRSVNGQTFENIGEVQGFGTTTEMQSYSLLDISPANGLNYYRLKQVDFDGRFEYSDVITVEIEKQQTSINVYPNPSKGLYNIQWSENISSQTNLEVFDMTGRLVHNEIIENNTSQLNLEHLMNGNYFLKFTNQNDVFTTRIVKMK